MKGFDSYLMRPEVLFIRGLLAVATDSIGSVTNDQTRHKIMEALLFFSGSRIDSKGREHKSQEELLTDAIIDINYAERLLALFFENHIIRNAEPSMQKRLKAAVKLAREESSPNLLEDLLKTLNIEAIIRDIYVSKRRRKEAMDNIDGLKRATTATGNKTALGYFQSLNDAETKYETNKKDQQRKMAASLIIGSIPSVKGLEFDHVVLPYLERGEFPSPNGSEQEEQNLFYVGMTRARRFLTLFASQENPSGFIQKMGYKPSATIEKPEQARSLG